MVASKNYTLVFYALSSNNVPASTRIADHVISIDTGQPGAISDEQNAANDRPILRSGTYTLDHSAVTTSSLLVAVDASPRQVFIGDHHTNESLAFKRDCNILRGALA